MSRSTLVAAGVIAWTAAIADGAIHLATGDLVVPGGMALIAVAYVATRRLMGRALARSAARA